MTLVISYIYVTNVIIDVSLQIANLLLIVNRLLIGRIKIHWKPIETHETYIK